MLEIKDLSISFKKTIFDHANFRCHDGEIVSIQGESGSGKTTFLKFIMGEISEATGQVFYNEVEITDDNRDAFLFNVVSYIDQMGTFFPNMSIYDHFHFYATSHHLSINQDIAKDYLKKVHLDYISLTHSPSKLSTGERKRFLLALALMMQKKIIIMDEPTASIDQKNINSLFNNIKELSIQGISFIITTHDQQVIDFSDSVYQIDQQHFVKIKDNNQNIVNERTDVQKPHKISYFRYKNLKMKIFFVLIILIGGLGFSYIAKTVVNSILLQYKASETQNTSVLYLVKSIDSRYSLASFSSSLLNDNADYYNMLDLINEEELEEISQIDGVQYVLPFYSMEDAHQSVPLKVYHNGIYLKDASKMVTDQYGSTYNRNIYLTAYYPEEEIKKDGELIQGIYIDEKVAQMIDMESLNGVEISLNVSCPVGLSYSTNQSDYPCMEITYDNAPLILSIDGILYDEEFNDGKYSDYGRIYIPIDQFNEIVADTFDIPQDVAIPYSPRQYKIICEPGMSEEVKLTIEETNELYYAFNNEIVNNSVVQQVIQIKESGLLMTSVISIIIVAGVILLNIYDVSQRKNEMVLLKREGLASYIRSYLRQDHLILFIGWLLVSTITLVIVWRYFEYTKFAYSVYLYSMTWLGAILVISLIVMLVRLMYEKRLINKVIVND